MSNDMSSLLLMATLASTATAMWVPDKRAEPTDSSASETTSKTHASTITKSADKSSSITASSTSNNSKSTPSTTSSKSTPASKSPESSTPAQAKTTKASKPASTSASTQASTPASTQASTPASTQASTPASTQASTPASTQASTQASSQAVSSNAASAKSMSSSSPSSASSMIATTKSVSSHSVNPSSSMSAEALVSTDASSSSSAPVGAIVGGIAAVIVVAIVGSAALLFVRRKRRRELKKSRAALMATRAEPYSDNYITDENKGYTDYEEEQIIENDARQSGYATYEPALASENYHNANPEMIEQQQQYYQTQSPNAVQGQNVASQVIPELAVVAGTTKDSSSLGQYTVIATYIPTLSDELEIEPGDVIELLTEYDDGWCQGINASRGNAKGVFPRHCIDHATVPFINTPSNFEKERTKRVSSMFVMGK